MCLTFRYGRKKSSPDKLCATIFIPTVAILSVTIFIASVHCTSVAIGADHAAVLIVARVSVLVISVCGIGGGACSKTLSIRSSVDVVVANKATGILRTIWCLPNAAGSLQALAIELSLSWDRRNSFGIHIPIKSIEKLLVAINSFCQMTSSVH